MIPEYKVGQTIKSFDFPGRDACFFIGRITSIEEEYIYCDTISQTWESVQLPQEQSHKEFRTLKQGVSFFDEKHQRVIILSE